MRREEWKAPTPSFRVELREWPGESAERTAGNGGVAVSGVEAVSRVAGRGQKADAVPDEGRVVPTEFGVSLTLPLSYRFRAV